MYLKRILEAKTEAFFCKKSKKNKTKKIILACTPRGPMTTHTQCCLLREDFVSNIYFYNLG